MKRIQGARNAGAYGAALSGAGSSVIAFAKPGPTARQVGQAMQKAFARHADGQPVRELAFENKGVRYR